MMKKTFVLGVIAASLALSACNQQGGAVQAASGAAAANAPVKGLETDAKKLGYLLGYEFANQIQLGEMKKSGVEVDTAALIEAFNDQIAGKEAKLSPEQAQAVLQNVSEKMQAAAVAAASEANAAGEKFLTENKAKEGIQTTASGLQYKVNKEGTGEKAKLGDMVSVEYEGRLTDGTVFDSTAQHGGEAFAVPLMENTVIAGWIEGLQLMQEGGEYTLYIPAKLAYGEQSPSPKIPANSVLVFDMKVKKIDKGAAKKVMGK